MGHNTEKSMWGANFIRIDLFLPTVFFTLPIWMNVLIVIIKSGHLFFLHESWFCYSSVLPASIQYHLHHQTKCHAAYLIPSGPQDPLLMKWACLVTTVERSSPGLGSRIFGERDRDSSQYEMRWLFWLLCFDLAGWTVCFARQTMPPVIALPTPENRLHLKKEIQYEAEDRAYCNWVLGISGANIHHRTASSVFDLSTKVSARLHLL